MPGSICDAPEASFIVLTRKHDADLLVERGDLRVVRRQRGDHRQVERGGKARPCCDANQGFSARLPSGAKSGRAPFSRITAVSAAGIWAMLVTSAPLR